MKIVIKKLDKLDWFIVLWSPTYIIFSSYTILRGQSNPIIPVFCLLFNSMALGFMIAEKLEEVE